MADKQKVIDPRAVLEAQKMRLLEQAEEVDRDLQELDRLGRLASKYGLQIVPGESPGSKPAKASMPPPKTNGQTGPLSVVVVKVAVDFLRQRGTRAQSPDIANALAARGTTVAAKLVSSYLTRKKDLFDNKPEFGGYGLVEWKGAERGPLKARVI